jgi:4-hydroxymandelate oxidase
MDYNLVSLYDYEALARLILPHNVWDFIDAGAMDEVTVRRNRSALDSLALRPRFLRDVENLDLSTTVLGTQISMPVMIAPAGSHKIAHTDGELATVRGAAKSRTLMMAASNSNYTMEEIAEATTTPRWFQLYHQHRGVTEILVRRAEKSGYKAICLTVDTSALSYKERDVRNRFVLPFKLANFTEMEAIIEDDETPSWTRSKVSLLTWGDLDWLRSLSALPLVLKGIRTAEDARLAVDHGVEGIFVSNHGGRQIDMTLSSIETLPEITEAVDGRAEIYMDSGIRRGSDVLKALVMGARAVAIGRPLFWGLAVGGANGVHRILEILRAELELALSCCGVTSVQDLKPGLLSVPQGWGTETVR